MSQRVFMWGAWVVLGWFVQAAAAPDTATAARRVVRVALESHAANDVDSVTREALNASMISALAQQRGLQVVPKERADFVLWGSVTQLSDRATRDEQEVDCKVTVIVAEAVGGSIRFTLAGRAVARGRSSARELTTQAMGAAVRGALTPLERGLSLVAR